MKKNYLFLLLLSATAMLAQCPTNLTTYYSSATGTGATLKTQLFNIIKGHNDRGYDGLWTTYQTSDRDIFTGTGFENDNSIYDLYSENPNGVDPYNFTYSTSQCGTYSVEGDCYNREHIIPQSSFGSSSPMRNDAHFVTPTDGKVNGFRADYPHGEVATVTRTMANGAIMGSSAVPGYTATVVYEPLDAFKGDIARMYFYYVTRYEDKMGTTVYEPFNNTTHPSIYPNFLAMLIQWHNSDPVSAFEIARNNAICARQNNRNPYIDHPEWVAAVWGGSSVSDTQAPTIATNLAVTGTTSSTASLSWTAATDNTAVTSYDVYVDGVLTSSTNGTTLTITGLSPTTTYAFYVVARDAAGNSSPVSSSVNGTTLAAGAPCSVTIVEDFEGIPTTTPGSYLARTWTNSTTNVTWNVTDARTDQTITTKAITIRNGSLIASSVPDGIADLTVTTQLKFAGTAGTFKLKVNGTIVGDIPYSTTGVNTTTTIPGINISGPVIISFDTNSTTSNRVAFDDLSWTCYSGTLSTTDFNENNFKIYPNPSNGQFDIEFDDYGKYNVQIFSTMGEKVFENKNIENKNISVNHLQSGIYLVKISNETKAIVKKIVIN